MADANKGGKKAKLIKEASDLGIEGDLGSKTIKQLEELIEAEVDKEIKKAGGKKKAESLNDIVKVKVSDKRTRGVFVNARIHLPGSTFRCKRSEYNPYHGELVETLSYEG